MSASREILKPAGEVFDFFADAANNPRWQTGMVSCEWATRPPLDVGSRYTQHARFMGRNVKSVFEVTHFEPGSSIQIETIESTFPINVHRWVVATGNDSCTVNAEITGGPTGLARFVGRLMANRAQRSVDADYDRLKKLLES